MNFAPVPDLTHSFPKNASAVLKPVTDSDLPELQSLLNQYQIDDPYQSSAGYFAMTGRRGLWMVRDGAELVLVCRHPNLDNTFLIFAPTAGPDTALTHRTLNALKRSGATVNLARVRKWPTAEKPIANDKALYREVPETALDWVYPVYVIDTGKVIAHEGRTYQQFRTKLNKLDPARITATDLDPQLHRQTVTDIVMRWAEGDAEKATPYTRLLDLFEHAPMHGRVIRYDGRPAAFSIWEETNPAAGLANAFAHIGLHDVAGISRQVMLDMCQVLDHRGFSVACIGGSENAGLNQFKRQLRPCRAIDLMTMIPQEPLNVPANQPKMPAPLRASI